MPILYVAIGGAIGSVFRYLIHVSISNWLNNPFPAATLVINVTGSFLMGLLMGWLTKAAPAYANELRFFLAIGVLGGYTTFSSFSLDAIRLMEQGKLLQMLVYVAGSVVVSLAGLAAGIYLIKATT